jgi:hypothetical protein
VTDADSARLVGAAAGVSVLGIAQGGGVGAVGFLADAVAVPLWFVILPWILPTGEVLKVVRAFVRVRLPEGERR